MTTKPNPNLAGGCSHSRSPAGYALTLEEWSKLSAEDAAQYFSEKVGIDDERRKKLEGVLKSFPSQNAKLTQSDEQPTK
jgi:hypothetical protein